jgi:hypothetical protein
VLVVAVGKGKQRQKKTDGGEKSGPVQVGGWILMLDYGVIFS